MQSLHLLLAVLLLTGAQARYFWQHDDPQTRLEHLQELGQVYLESAKAAVHQAVAHFDSSSVAQELQVNLGQKLEGLAKMLQGLGEDLVPELQEIKTELHTLLERVKEEVTKDMQAVGAQIQPLWRTLQENVQQDATAHFQQLKTITQDINQAAQERIQPVAEGFRDKLRGHVNQFRKDVAPYARQLEQLIQEKAKALEQSAQTELAELQAELQKQLGEVREKYGPLWEKACQELLTLLDGAKALFAGPEQQQQSS